MHHLVGQHCLIDAYAVDEAWSKDAVQIEALLRKVAKAAQATIINSHFHTFGEGGGVTGVLLLAESHISIHTWPENAYIAVDIFMCGQHHIQAALEAFKSLLPSTHINVRIFSRGEALVPVNLK